MTRPRIKTAIWDIETNGLLLPTPRKDGSIAPALTRVHCLVIRDFERRITYRFRRNESEDTIDEGIDLLEDAEVLVGHNILHFDIPALDRVYVGINMRGIVRDTLPLCRMCFANQKDLDFRLFEKGKLPGQLIGAHGLEAWGYRLGLHKGDYAKEMEDKGLDPWAEWSAEQEDYCVNDVEVNTLLWERIRRAQFAETAVRLEQQVHDLMGQQERNGIHFDVLAATKLAEELADKAAELSDLAVQHYGKWWKPAKKVVVRALWDDPDGINKAKSYAKPRAEFGEDDSRAVWAEVTVPKKTMRFKEVLRADRTEGHPYCAVELGEFNPNSRQQIVDRFVTVYGWHPVDFTDKGNPEVSDPILRNLVGHIPMAEELAEVFFYKKTLGMVRDGPQAWLRKVVDGKIHHYCNTGGTISGRASHVSPNLAQVPKVKSRKDKVTKQTHILLGREGDYGWECRSLFYVPKPWVLTGCDLSGIELRCLGEKLRRWDKGAYLELILHGDIHTYNQELAGLPTRDNAKTFIYALVYGAGDIKLGSIVDPLASEEDQRAIGARLRAKFLDNLPAFKSLVKQVQSWAKQGHLPGLDGRKLFVRSPHSALNTLLQSDAALIAKKWACLTEERLEDEGFNHGWEGDFAFQLWVHDELQIASLGHEDLIASVTIAAAREAGLFFGYECPVDAEAKSGRTWAETH